MLGIGFFLWIQDQRKSSRLLSVLITCHTVVLIPRLKIAWGFCSMYVTGLGGAEAAGEAHSPHLTHSRRTWASHKTTQPERRLDSTAGTIRTGLKLAYRSHGEVSDPHHHPGERPPAHDQPLLPGREGPGAEPWASYAGQGPGCPAAVPRPDGATGVSQQQPAPWRSAAMC